MLALLNWSRLIVVNSDKCFDGWASGDGNSEGRCCCNCKNQVKIVGHPWNKNSAYKSRICDTIGWGCAAQPGTIVFFEKKHGMCEEHDWAVESINNE